MRQCKLCGTPLGSEPTDAELESHWRRHHGWHWESNRDRPAAEAILR